jgi:hypothetical protein
VAALWWTRYWKPCWTNSPPLDNGGDGGLICTILTNGNPKMVTFWRKKLASYTYEGYASKSTFTAGSGLTAKRIGAFVEDLRAVDQWPCLMLLFDPTRLSFSFHCLDHEGFVD